MWRPLSRRRRERERDEEMRAHLALYEEELTARGRSPEEARREARVRFGNRRARLEEIDAMTRLPLLDALSRDLRYAIRVLRRTPVFTATAVLTLALAIGANTAVFSLADTVLFTPPPYPEPERLAFVVARVEGPGGLDEQLSHDTVTWEAVRDQVPSLDAAVYFGGVSGVNLNVGDRAAFVEQQRVSAGYFRVLGLGPAIGREFTPAEDVPGGPAVAILSHRVWQREFGGDAAILGRAIRLRGEPYEVVGVMPAAFDETGEVDVWTPLRPSRSGEGGSANFQIVGRLGPGASWDQAQEELRRAGAGVLRNRGVLEEEGRSGHLAAAPMVDVLAEGNREPIAMLGAASMVVLLIAAVNIAALLLGRGAGRSKEIATRMALGCGKRAVVRQLMVESLVLGLAGGALGVLVARVGLSGLQHVAGTTFELWADAAIDGRVLLVTGGLVLVTSVLFGLVPALQASRLQPQRALADGGARGVAGGRRRWPGRALVLAEVALGVALLVVTGLLVRTFVNLRGLEPGFDPAGLVTASVSLQDARYATAGSVRGLANGSLQELRAMPGVRAAAVSLQAPYTRLLNWSYRFAGEDAERGTMVNASYVSDQFFQTYGIPVHRGRAIDATDGPQSAPVVVVNEAFVRAFSADRPAIGRRVQLSGADREIVGVVGNVQQLDSGISFEGRVDGPLIAMPIVYLPVSQAPASLLNAVHTWFRPVWAVRPQATGATAGAIAQAIARVDPMLPVGAEEAVAAMISRATAGERLMMTLVGVLAGAAVLLAVIGLHGVVAHAVSTRTREFAIRLALGASVPATVGGVAATGLAVAAAGAGMGVLLSLWAVGLVRGLLWSVGEYDPATYASVVALFLVVAAAASAIPALRIARLDPAKTLRN